MEKPLVSVIMPSYNHAEYVGRAIESVLNQTYSNFEFIIADDGSTDGSPEVIEQYHDPRISFTRFEENTGFGASEYIYNKAKGKYIAAICSDDMWKNTLLEKYVSFLEENNSYVCCFCRPEIVDENDNVIVVDTLEEIFYAENQKKEEWFKDFYTRGNCICAPSMCIRKSAFDKLGSLRFQFRQLQDFEYWMRLVQIGNIYIYPEKLMYYRRHYEGENRNISAATEEVNIRDIMERKYIMYDIMENVTDEYFMEAFKDDFVLPKDSDGFCIECEKFSVMLNSRVVPVHASIFYYFNHYNDERFRYHLENFYHVKRKDFWKITGIEHDRGILVDHDKQMINDLSNMVCALKQLVWEKDMEIARLKESHE